MNQYPKLNVLINNAGITKVDSVHNPVGDALISSIVSMNLLGPIRMTSALVEHFKQQPAAHVIHVTSGTAFVPLAVTTAYSATMADLHSFSLSQPYLLRDTSVRVLELAPCSNRTDARAPEVYRRNRHARGSDRASCLSSVTAPGQMTRRPQNR